jgi:hypothetical protein
MITFTFNENEYIGWDVQNMEEFNMTVRKAAFVVYLQPAGVHRFKDGPFPLTPNQTVNKFLKNGSSKLVAGPIVFAVLNAQQCPTLLFKTREYYIIEDTPRFINLMEYDMEFYNKDGLRNMVTVLNRQQPGELQPFEEMLFQIAKKTEEERLRRLEDDLSQI